MSKDLLLQISLNRTFNWERFRQDYCTLKKREHIFFPLFLEITLS